MGVTRLPNPGLIPTSQEAGGTVHSNALAQTAPGSAPGFDGGQMNYPVSTDSPPLASSAHDDRNPVQPSGAGDSTPGAVDVPFAQGGSFGAPAYGNADRWKKTPSSS